MSESKTFNYQPPKVWVSSFLSVDGNAKLVSAITENGKNGCSSPKMHPRAKLSITDPLKFGSPVFRVSTEMENWCRPLQKMGKMAIAPQKRILEQNFQFTNPPKVWVSGFLSVDGNAKLVSAITENGTNGCSSPKMHPRAKLPITDPPKVWVSSFPSVNRNAKLVSAITENGKNGHSSPKMCTRAKLSITNPLKFGFPVFWVSTEMQNWCQPLRKMGKWP